MLTSAKRRILNILSVSMAIASVAYGLVLKYDNGPAVNNFAVQAEIDKQELTVQESPVIVKANNLLSDPN